jgi:hypothetical protein
MILIAHRGNINGPNPKLENRPDYLWTARYAGYEVEADVWYDGGWWLGHDKPQYKVPNRNILYQIWCHAKNDEALERMRMRDIYHCFWHQKDDYTLTSNGYIWAFPNKKLVKGCICVLPEMYDRPIEAKVLQNCAGICSDYVKKYK